MARDAISTLTGSSTDGTQTHVTGTQVGTKRALDVNVASVGGTTTDEALAWDTTSTANTVYVGYAAAGTATSAASWKIVRYSLSTGLGKWADGNTSYDNVWDNRTGLSYS